MMKNLNKNDIDFLINCLKNGKEIPEIYKYAIFPTKQKEYEIVYAGKMRKEDVLADTEEAKPVPLQIEKVFNGKKNPTYSKNWHNLLVFGDNLQILKTFYENKDLLVKNKIKGKVKLIYIDPPFATAQDFSGNKGQKAYSDKTKGAEFVEFLRRRLLLMHEILADDGSIFIHLDWKKAQYMKVVMDEVFGENNFVNEIIWHYSDNFQGNVDGFAVNHNNIFWYSKSDVYTANKVMIPLNGVVRRDKRIWSKELGKLVSARDKQGKLIYEDFTEKKADDVWEIGQSSTTKSASREYIGYPTQKPEELLRRIILAASNPDDIIMDVFAGSGTTLAVAEKLNRRWIGCDIGKLAIYTTQKRLLEIDQSKNLNDKKKTYDKPAKSFAIVTSGLYDLGKIFALQKDEYVRFVKDLFEIEETKVTKISGVEIDGKKREFYAKIFPYWELKNVSVDEKYLQELHKNIGEKISHRFYIIAPANNVNFISDYHEIGEVRYYFLKVPYQIIKELHKVQFKKFRQPQSKSQINDLDEAIGFHFIRQPEVRSEVKKLKDKIVLKIKRFESAYSQDETGEKLKNFESLAMLLLDLNYDGEKFMMTNCYFAQDLLNHKVSNEEESEEEIKKKLKKQKEIIKEFPKNSYGKEIMAIYVDIYGNEFREVFRTK
jgi:site-specific DNA-methyltransferase (adenine-specific)/adenine-specific DNA-methyltransferase